MTYDANHRLLTMTDANGHTFVRNVYDANGRVSEQYDALNNKWTFAYDEPAHKTLVTDPRGFVTTYQYDGDWRLTSEKDPLNYTASYAYDADNNRTQVTDKRGNATHYAYDGRGNTTIITDALNGTRSFTYDTTPAATTSSRETDPLGHTTAYAYDAHSNLTQRTDAARRRHDLDLRRLRPGDIHHRRQRAHDDLRLRPPGTATATSTTDALGHTTTATYDSAGRKLTETDPLGRMTHLHLRCRQPRPDHQRAAGQDSPTYTYDAVGNRTHRHRKRNTHHALRLRRQGPPGQRHRPARATPRPTATTRWTTRSRSPTRWATPRPPPTMRSTGARRSRMR